MTFFRWHCSCFLHWAMPWMFMEMLRYVVWILNWILDHTVSLFWNLVQLEMVKHWIQLHSRMQFSISSHLLIRVVLSSMCHQDNGLPEVSILLAISPSFWKKVLSLLDLRYFHLLLHFLTYSWNLISFVFFMWGSITVIFECIEIRQAFLSMNFVCGFAD